MTCVRTDLQSFQCWPSGHGKFQSYNGISTGWFVSAFPIVVCAGACFHDSHSTPRKKEWTLLWFAGEHAGLLSTDFCRWKPNFRSFTAPPLKIDRPKRKLVFQRWLQGLVWGGPKINTSKPTGLWKWPNLTWAYFWDGWFNQHQGP